MGQKGLLSGMLLKVLDDVVVVSVVNKRATSPLLLLSKDAIRLKKVLDGDHLDLPPAKDKNNSGKKCIGKKFPLTIKIKGSQLNTCFLSDLAINSVFFFQKTTSTIPFHSPHLSLFTALFLPNFSLCFDCFEL